MPNLGPFDVLLLAMFALVGIFVVGVVVFMVVALVKNKNALQDAGLDPITAQAELAGKLANSELLTPVQSLESRLAELDDLHARKIITTDEYQAARASALQG